ncbi:MAG: DUF1045 domain-containing protein [Pseudomonadota bacterium]
MEFRRYGIYYTPQDGAFAEAGARWLGWNSATGKSAAPPPLRDLPFPLDDITATPRKYGFHATFKPPFRLAPDCDAKALTQAFDEHCQSLGPVALDGLKLAALGRFMALVPEGDIADLAALAASCVRDLDRFRAPATAQELAKRRATGLTSRQDALLEKWGYPYVLDEFRFHMTLTGKLPKDALAEVASALAAHVLPHVPRPVPIEALSLMGEDGTGRFHLIHRRALSG